MLCCQAGVWVLAIRLFVWHNSGFTQAIFEKAPETRRCQLLEQLEQQLDRFNLAERKAALKQILAGLADGRIKVKPVGRRVNLHAHTFFSFNCYGYSPSKFAWLAKKEGLAAAGIVDFDVLDGADEFLDAAAALNVRGCASIETRVYVPEFSDLVINSPGEPGIAYHMGSAVPFGTLSGAGKVFLDRLKETAQRRNREMMERVNAYLDPVRLDYEKDVLPLTPAGNPTERHLCLAYARKARVVCKDDMALLAFWKDKLGCSLHPQDFPESPALLNAIRAKTMKKGGPGYVAPDAGAFATMQQMNEFVLAAGGIPTLAWLDGTTEGEQQIERLLDIAMNTGVAALNIIPDRNFTPGVEDQKLANLRQVVALADARGLPILVGTEMNSFGQKFCDDFESAELKPMIPVFLKGAHILYAHTVLQRAAKMGYLSPWAKKCFCQADDKNSFFEAFGRAVEPKQIDTLRLEASMSPDDILKTVNA